MASFAFMLFLPMFKKGDITKCENYRTISRINHSSKVLPEIIRSRMKPYVETILAEEQAGFRPGLYSRTGPCFEDPYSTSHWEERWEGFCCIHRLQEGFWQSLVWWSVYSITTLWCPSETHQHHERSLQQGQKLHQTEQQFHWVVWNNNRSTSGMSSITRSF